MNEENLKELVAKIAKEELREDENTRRQSLEQFRNWILKNPDITGCRTDDNFLLQYLRSRKFSVPMAQEMLIKSIIFKRRLKHTSEKLDMQIKELNDAISTGFYLPSPYREDNGRTVCFIQINKLDLNKYNYRVPLNAVNLCTHVLVEDEIIQVTGITFVVGLENLNPSIFTHFPVSVIYTILKNMQATLPLRVKRIYCINPSVVGTRLLNLAISVLPQKLKDRIKVFTTIEEMHTVLDPKVFPLEMGGSMPMADMVDLWKQKILHHREAVLATDRIQLSEEKYKVNCNFDEMEGIPGSFKKLEVD